MLKKTILIIALLVVAFGVYRLVDKEGALRLRDKITFWDNNKTTSDEAAQEVTEESIQQDTIVLGESTPSESTGTVVSEETAPKGSLLDSVITVIEEKEDTGGKTGTTSSTIVPPTLGGDNDRPNTTETTTNSPTTPIPLSTGSTPKPTIMKKKTTTTKSVLHQLFK